MNFKKETKKESTLVAIDNITVRVKPLLLFE